MAEPEPSPTRSYASRIGNTHPIHALREEFYGANSDNRALLLSYAPLDTLRQAKLEAMEIKIRNKMLEEKAQAGDPHALRELGSRGTVDIAALASELAGTGSGNTGGRDQVKGLVVPPQVSASGEEIKGSSKVIIEGKTRDYLRVAPHHPRAHAGAAGGGRGGDSPGASRAAGAGGSGAGGDATPAFRTSDVVQPDAAPKKQREGGRSGASSGLAARRAKPKQDPLHKALAAGMLAYVPVKVARPAGLGPKALVTQAQALDEARHEYESTKPRRPASAQPLGAYEPHHRAGAGEHEGGGGGGAAGLGRGFGGGGLGGDKWKDVPLVRVQETDLMSEYRAKSLRDAAAAAARAAALLADQAARRNLPPEGPASPRIRATIRTGAQSPRGRPDGPAKAPEPATGAEAAAAACRGVVLHGGKGPAKGAAAHGPAAAAAGHGAGGAGSRAAHEAGGGHSTTSVSAAGHAPHAAAGPGRGSPGAPAASLSSPVPPLPVSCTSPTHPPPARARSDVVSSAAAHSPAHLRSPASPYAAPVRSPAQRPASAGPRSPSRPPPTASSASWAQPRPASASLSAGLASTSTHQLRATYQPVPSEVRRSRPASAIPTSKTNSRTRGAARDSLLLSCHSAASATSASVDLGSLNGGTSSTALAGSTGREPWLSSGLVAGAGARPALQERILDYTARQYRLTPEEAQALQQPGGGSGVPGANGIASTTPGGGGGLMRANTLGGGGGGVGGGGGGGGAGGVKKVTMGMSAEDAAAALASQMLQRSVSGGQAGGGGGGGGSGGWRIRPQSAPNRRVRPPSAGVWAGRPDYEALQAGGTYNRTQGGMVYDPEVQPGPLDNHINAVASLGLD